MELNKTELQDLDYLMESVVEGKSFYALEISKAKYLLGRIKELRKKEEDLSFVPPVTRFKLNNGKE